MVTASSVVETDRGEVPEEQLSWEDLGTAAVRDKYDEYLSESEFVPFSRRVSRVGERIAKYHDPQQAVIEAAVARHATVESPLDVLATFGGLEIAMMAGAMLKAAELRKVLLIDGFIVTSALLLAARLQPAILDYCVFAHCSDETGHQQMLAALNAKPLLNLGLRLGEGTGCALALPLLHAAVSFLNQMATFESAQVSEKSA